jgi:hypothetical protein
VKRLVRIAARALVMGILAWVVQSCKQGVRPPAAAAQLEAAHVLVGIGTPEPLRCVPSGQLEQCFNAIDDNCDGLIDEGCGVPSGPLQITLTWGDNPVDLDLSVSDPDGRRVSRSTRQSGALRFDRNCPEEDCGDASQETVVGTEPAAGLYLVEVRSLVGAARKSAPRYPVRATLGVRYFERNLSFTLEIGPAETRVLRFQINPSSTASKINL